MSSSSTSLGSQPSSRERIATTRLWQKPLWQRPMPARQRRLTPSTETAPGWRRIAATISASGTVSQRQTICPHAGSDSISSFAIQEQRYVGLAHLVDKALCILGTGELLFKVRQAKAGVDALA